MTVAILGVFVADTTYRASRMPVVGETILGSGFALGPGGKGSNQAVAAARAGGDVRFLGKLGRDAFVDLADGVWAEAGVVAEVMRIDGGQTGAAMIFVAEGSGDNAIIVSPGVAATISAVDVDGWGDIIASAGVFVTQLEQPMEAAMRGLQLARDAGVVTLLNPAPAAPLPDGMLSLCDYVTPNETEAEALTGIAVDDLDSARRAGDALLAAGVARAAILTLGARGALYHAPDTSVLVPAIAAGEVVETTGAGDAFNGGFAAALDAGAAPLDAVRFGCATAGLSVTRPGAAASMPVRAEIDALLATMPH